MMRFRRCDWFLVVLSPQSVESIWVKREVVYAFDHDRYNIKIISVIYQSWEYEEKLSWILPQFQMVDFTGSLEEGYVNLFRIWGRGYKGSA